MTRTEKSGSEPQPRTARCHCFLPVATHSHGTFRQLKAIGKRFGLTRERVRQMEKQALAKLGEVMSREFGEELPAPRQAKKTAR